MNKENSTQKELPEQLQGLRKRISELEAQLAERDRAEKTQLEAIGTEHKEVEEELNLRYAQLKASEQELAQTQNLLKENEENQNALQKSLQKTEKHLRESEEQFRILVEHLPIMLAVQDITEKKYVFWNRSEGWSGYTLDEWNRLSYEAQKKLIHLDDQARYLSTWRNWEQSNFEKPLHIIYRLRHKDGFYRNIEAWYYRQVSSDGKKVEQIELSRDITPRILAEENQRKSEEKYRLLTEDQTELVFKTDTDGSFLFVNPAFCKTFGKIEQELLGKKYTTPVHEDDIDATSRALKALSREPYSSQLEHRTLTALGWKWIAWSYRAERDEKGRVVAFVGIGTDITSHKRMEEKLENLQSEIDSKVEERTTELAETNARLIKQIEQQGQNEAELLENRAKLQTLFNTMKDFLFIHDEQGRIEHINPEVLEKLDHSEEELLGTLESMEQAAEAQRKTRTDLQMLFDTLEEFIFVLDSKGHILNVNSAAIKRLDYTNEELSGMNIFELHPPNLRDEATAILADTVAGKTRTYNIPLLASDKTVIPVETRLNLGRWGNKNVLIAACRDVTDLKMAKRDLEQSEQKFRLIAEQTSIGTCILEGGTVQYANPRFAEILGYTIGEILNSPTFDLETIIHPDDRETYLKQIRSRRQSSARVAASPSSVKATQKSGETIWIDLYTKPITYKGKSAVLVTITDTTERKRAEDETWRREIQLREAEKIETAERLSGAVAHDFNELLTIITGHSDLGMMSLRSGDPIRYNLEQIIQATESGSNLTWQLLTFAGKHKMDAKVQNLNKILDEMDKSLQRLMGKYIDLENITEKKLWKVKVDTEQIERIIVNLTTNAREAMPDGGKLTIETSNIELNEDQHLTRTDIPPGPYVMLRFTDTGCGMTEDARRRMFDPFFTTKKMAKGAGLGLSTVYGIIKKCGGYIEVESKLDEGTTLRIYLPRVMEKAGKEEKELEVKERARPSETILVVEDDEAVRNMAAQILKEFGYRIIEASSGKEALQICKELEKPVDLVISDVYMPNIGGAELVDKLRRLWHGVKVIYISGATDETDLDASIPLLRKPFHPRKLVQEVKEMLKG